MNRTIVAVVTAAALALGAGSVAAVDKIRIGVEGAYPPFSWVEPDGSLKGFDIDVARALCAQMKVQCELVQQDWDGIIPALMARKYDAIIASMSITEERKKKVDFTDKYYQTPAKFARKKGSGITIDAAGLKDKTVGVQRATTHDNFVTEKFGKSVQVKRYGSQDEAYLDAQSGRLDLLLADSVAMNDGFITQDAGKDWEFVGPGYVDQKYFGDGAGIAVRKGDALREKLNAAIKAIIDNGTYKQINDTYFSFDVYGG